RDDVDRRGALGAAGDAHLHPVLARLLDRLVEVDLAAVDRHAERGTHPLGDVGVGDRSKEAALLADPRRDLDLEAVDPLGQASRPPTRRVYSIAGPASRPRLTRPSTCRQDSPRAGPADDRSPPACATIATMRELSYRRPATPTGLRIRAAEETDQFACIAIDP